MGKNRDAITTMAVEAVKIALADGHQVNVGEVARAILKAAPDLDIPLTEIESEIARVALVSGIGAVEFGPRDQD